MTSTHGPSIGLEGLPGLMRQRSDPSPLANLTGEGLFSDGHGNTGRTRPILGLNEDQVEAPAATVARGPTGDRALHPVRIGSRPVGPSHGGAVADRRRWSADRLAGCLIRRPIREAIRQSTNPARC